MATPLTLALVRSQNQILNDHIRLYPDDPRGPPDPLEELLVEVPPVLPPRWEITDWCRTNHELFSVACDSVPIGKFPKFPGDGFPIGWKHHHGCPGCKTFEDFMKFVPPAAKHPQAAKPNTEYAFTLTMPPDYVPHKSLEEVARLILERGITNKPYEKADEWAFVLEHTEKGTPHIHGVYKTPSGRRIAKKYFKRYWPLWDEDIHLGAGHKGGYHAPARHSESYHAYLLKEGVVVKNSPA